MVLMMLVSNSNLLHSELLIHLHVFNAQFGILLFLSSLTHELLSVWAALWTHHQSGEAEKNIIPMKVKHTTVFIRCTTITMRTWYLPQPPSCCIISSGQTSTSFFEFVCVAMMIPASIHCNHNFVQCNYELPQYSAKVGLLLCVWSRIPFTANLFCL